MWRGVGGDLLGLREEAQPGEPLLAQVMSGGRRVGQAGSIESAHIRFVRELAGVPAEALTLETPRPRVARVSDALAALADRAQDEALQRASR